MAREHISGGPRINKTQVTQEPANEGEANLKYKLAGSSKFCTSRLQRMWYGCCTDVTERRDDSEIELLDQGGGVGYFVYGRKGGDQQSHSHWHDMISLI